MKNNFSFKPWLYPIMIGLCIALNTKDAMAQESTTSEESSLAIGAKIGANFNQFSQPGTSMGGSVGGYARYQLLDFLQIQGELIYSLQGGARSDYTQSLSDISGLVNAIGYTNRNVLLHTVEIPISARLGLPELEGGAIVPKLIVGGSYSYNFAAFEKNNQLFFFDNGTQFLLSDRNENVTGDFFDHNLSAHIGVALDFNLDNGKVFTMEFKYRQGFSNLNERKSSLAELNENLRSSSFSLNFSYRIF